MISYQTGSGKMAFAADRQVSSSDYCLFLECYAIFNGGGGGGGRDGGGGGGGGT